MVPRCLMLAMAACVCMALAGCSWRPQAPSVIGQTIAIRVVADQGRLPRAGLDLQAAAAEKVPYRTGWQVRGDGEARLDLSIDRDDFSATATDERDIASRWRYRVYVTALLVSKHGHRTWSGIGTGYAGSRVEEQIAVQAAAADVADDLARWLATQQF